MIRLHMTAEGQTEKKFADEILTPHLAHFGVFVDARCVLTSKDRRAAKAYRGGMTSYTKARNDILAWIMEDSGTESRFTTMFDLYALPNDFPGFQQAQGKQDAYQRIDILEAEFGKDIDSQRFVPYLQLHEFEALILADPSALDWEYLEHDQPIRNLVSMVDGQNPELINDGRESAPSKRIIKEIPEYDKVTSGVAVAKQIGLATLREKCCHFDQWLTRLEALAGGSNAPPPL